MFFERHEGGERAILVHLESQDEQSREDPHEFLELVRSAGAEAVEFLTISRYQPSPRFLIGSGKVEELRALVQRREQLVQQRDDDRRRLKQATHERVRTCLAEHILWLRGQIRAIGKDIARLQQQVDDDLARRLMAVPGIGPVTAASLQAYLPELGHLERREIAALAGLAPYNADSGKKEGKRRIRGGRGPIRRVLYMACWCVIRLQPDFQARYRRLRDQGKCAKVAITACMRVLLIRLNAMARDKTEWRSPAW